MGDIITKITNFTKFGRPISSVEYKTEAAEPDNSWFEENYAEGQLAIDVYHTPTKLIIKSTIAGASAEDIDISLSNDMLTIRGTREMPDEVKEADSLHTECYWGPFSRTIILPVEIDPKKIKASMENGVLTVSLTKLKSSRGVSIKVEEK